MPQTNVNLQRVQEVHETGIRVKKLRDLSRDVVVESTITDVGRQAATVERIAHVLWVEVLMLRHLLIEQESEKPADAVR